jgi:hypothetical protein
MGLTLVFAPQGQPSIARGGAQRNPWIGFGHVFSPERATESVAPSGLGDRAIGFQGLRCASPLAIDGRPFGAKAKAIVSLGPDVRN